MDAFRAPGSEHCTVPGDSFSGVYDTGAQHPSIVQWTVHEVE